MFNLEIVQEGAAWGREVNICSRYSKTSQIADLKDLPTLCNLITEIFIE